MATARALLAALALLSAPVYAEDRQSGFWAGADLGYASLKRERSVTGSETDSKPALQLRGGYFWHPQLLLGVQVGGWNLEAADWYDPSKGEGIETFFLVAQYYPSATAGFFVNGGLGRIKYWNNRPLEYGATGSGGALGLGYDFRLGGTSFYLTPIADVTWGRFDGAVSPPGVTQDQRFRAVTLRIGITYR